jgi:hypothetical protein
MCPTTIGEWRTRIDASLATGLWLEQRLSQGWPTCISVTAGSYLGPDDDERDFLRLATNGASTVGQEYERCNSRVIHAPRRLMVAGARAIWYVTDGMTRLAEDGDGAWQHSVAVWVVALAGRRIWTISLGNAPADRHQHSWDSFWTVIGTWRWSC